MDLLLGLDVGTTATKAILFDLQGNVIASASHLYSLITPQPGWVEQDPEDLWRGVVETVRAALAQIGSGDRVIALAQSSQGGTTIPVDERGQPIGNAISWMDGRAQAQSQHVRETLGSEFIASTTGWPLGNGLPLLHVAWLHDNCPAEFRRTHRFLFVNDFIMHRLAGRCYMDPSDASITQLFDITLSSRHGEAEGEHPLFPLNRSDLQQAGAGDCCGFERARGALQQADTGDCFGSERAKGALSDPRNDMFVGDWDDRLLSVAGIRRDQLSPLRPSGYPAGTLTAEASAILGLPPHTLVVNGAHDQYCAAVGTGVTRPGAVLLSCGTAWVILAVPDSLEAGRRSGMAMSCSGWPPTAAAPGRWGAIRSLGGVGASVEWFLRETGSLGKNRFLERYDALNQAVARSPAGANGLLFAPPAGGHVTWSQGRGGLWGLSLSHTWDDLARALLEGIAFELRWAMDEVRAGGVQVNGWKMVGGAAQSPVWPQIVADVTGVPVALPPQQAACRGAALLAGVGAGLWADVEAGFAAFRGQETHLEPDAGRIRLYDGAFDRYKKAVGWSGPG